MATLELSNVTKKFGKNAALNKISLKVNDGEFLVLLGPTGAGKTTTLRCVAGLERLSEGEVLLDEEPQGTIPPSLRDVVLVFQNYALYPRKTVYENMAFPLEARKMPPEQQKTLIHEVARKLKIDHYLDRKPAQLSGGQQQRVALGRAMVRRPRVYLMDEPLTNLDFQLRVEMRGELKRLQRELNGTFFYVTNDQVEALSLADRIAVLNKGILQQVDTPEKIYQQPANLFVAGFIGTPHMNLLDGIYDINTHDLKLDNASWQISLTDNQHKALERYSGQAIKVGVRAEDIQLQRQSAPNTNTCQVYAIEPLGDRQIVTVKVGKVMLKIKMPPTFSATINETLYFNLLVAEALHFFYVDNGQRII
jgi:multiple sugar transport system ATP-binding protein